MNSIAAAVKFCEALDKPYKRFTTSVLLELTGIKKTSHSHALQILNRLTKVGVVHRSGSVGKFEWMMSDSCLNARWNQSDPFKTSINGADPQMYGNMNQFTNPTAKIGYRLNGLGVLFYNQRHWLKGEGCWFIKNPPGTAGGNWYAPSMEKRDEIMKELLPTQIPKDEEKALASITVKDISNAWSNALMSGFASPKVVSQASTGNAPAKQMPVVDFEKLITKVQDLTKENDQLKKDLFDLDDKHQKLETVASSGKKYETLIVKCAEEILSEQKEVTVPAQFKRVLALASARRNILLVGPAGCGKTYLGKLVSDSLGLPFGSISCTSGMSEAHLLGRTVPNFTTGESVFQTTEFLRCYETGGVFLLDEFDAADPNVMLAVNSAIANGYCNVPGRPDKPHAKRHKDFVLIATANTFGRGANRMYAGRNQMDEATIDRFRIGIVECYYDPMIEKTVCPDVELRDRLQGIRVKIEAAGLRRIMSTRFMEDAWIMSKAGDWTQDDIVKAFFEGWTKDELAKVK